MRYYVFGTKPSHALVQVINRAVQALTALSFPKDGSRQDGGLIPVSRPRQGTRPARAGTLKLSDQPTFRSRRSSIHRCQFDLFGDLGAGGPLELRAVDPHDHVDVSPGTLKGKLPGGDVSSLLARRGFTLSGAEITD